MGSYSVKHAGCKQRNIWEFSFRWMRYRKKYDVKGRAINIELLPPPYRYLQLPSVTSRPMDLRKEGASPLPSHFSTRSDATAATGAIGLCCVLLAQRARLSGMQQFCVQSIIKSVSLSFSQSVL